VSGPEHYAEAERLLGTIEPKTPIDIAAAYAALAQAHATLAQAAATVEPLVSSHTRPGIAAEWAQVTA
jgi:hypothetical protein